MYTLNILQRLVSEFPQVDFHLIYDRVSSVGDPFIIGKNVTHHVVQPPARHPLLWRIWNSSGVPRKLRAIGADLYWSPDGLPAKTTVPQWLTIHDLNFEHHPEWLKANVAQYYQREIRWGAELSERIFTVSHWTAGDLVERYGVDAAKIQVTPNATSRMFLPGTGKKLPYFLAVGALTPRKNLATLIRAFDLWLSRGERENYTLKIAGASHVSDKGYKALMSELRQPEKIEFLGRVSDNDLELLYREAQLFCMPSAMEGFGIPVLEAMMTHTPVMSARNSALTEVVGSGGLLLPTYDVEAWAKGFDQALEQGPELVSRGLEQVKKFDWEISTEVIARALREKLNGAG